jgi:hypothetical protein
MPIREDGAFEVFHALRYHIARQGPVADELV